jgi:hypothetical protein
LIFARIGRPLWPDLDLLSPLTIVVVANCFIVFTPARLVSAAEKAA